MDAEAVTGGRPHAAGTFSNGGGESLGRHLSADTELSAAPSLEFVPVLNDSVDSLAVPGP